LQSLRYGSIYAAADFDNNYLYQLVQSAIETGSIVHNGDGEELREYVHVKDVSELSVQVMEDRRFVEFGSYANRKRTHEAEGTIRNDSGNHWE